MTLLSHLEVRPQNSNDILGKGGGSSLSKGWHSYQAYKIMCSMEVFFTDRTLSSKNRASGNALAEEFLRAVRSRDLVRLKRSAHKIVKLCEQDRRASRIKGRRTRHNRSVSRRPSGTRHHAR